MLDALDRLRQLGRRILMLIRRNRFDADLNEEMRLHRELSEREEIERGVSAEEARYAAQRRFGNDLVLREESRDMWGWYWLESLLQDIRFALRQLKRNSGFSAIAVITLALGIGANTAIFSVVNAVLLRPLPFPDPSRIMMVWHTPPQKSFPGVKRFVVSPANFLDWRRENHVFEQMAAIGFHPFNLTGNGQPESVLGAKVSANFFSVLRVRPELGRAFVADDDQPGRGNVVILTDAFWRSHFGADRNVLGKTIRMDDQAYTVIGVLSAEFSFPFQAQLSSPLAWTDKERVVRGNHNYLVIARLQSGVSQKQAQAEMDTISNRLAQQYPADNAGWGAAVVPFAISLLNGSVRSALLVLLGAVGFVLLIACTNVANLTLAKALGRRKEIAIRTVLGATRLRVIRQVLSETVLLSLAGGAFGLVLAHFLVDGIAAFLAPQLPFPVTIGLDPWILAFTLTISVLTGILAGLAPSWHFAKSNLNISLKQGLGKTDSDSGGRARNVFVVAEVALSLVLLIGAGLTLRTLYLLRNVNPGFDPHHVLTSPLAISEKKYDSAERQTGFFDNVLELVRALPAVDSAGAVDSLPFQGGSTQPIIAEGQPVVPMADQPEVPVRVITPGYLRAMRIPLLQGRDLSDADRAGSQPVILVSEAFAKRFWPRDNPLGKHVTLTFSPGPSSEVVGVVGDVKIRGLADTRAIGMVYEAMNQKGSVRGMVLTVRTRTAPASLISAVTDAVHHVDREEPLVQIVTMETVAEQSLGQQKLSMVLLGAFAGLALLLCAVGLYGVVSYSVGKRRHEIGIRMALGAQKSDVFRMVVGQGLRLALVGVIFGVFGGFVLTRFLASLLYGVAPTDPLTFIVVSLILTTVAVAASYVPARRATKVDPIVALRYE